MTIKNINQLFAEYGVQIPVLSEMPETLPKGAQVIVMENEIPKLYVGSETNVPVSPESGKEIILPEPPIAPITPRTAEAGDYFDFMGMSYGVVQSLTGRLWLDRNLGASNQATSWNNMNAYGDLYQWGRFADGHQLRQSATRTEQSDSNTPGHGDMIVTHNDWHVAGTSSGSWNAYTRINLPAPIGWRIPTTQEWQEEIATWNAFSADGAFASVLKLPLTGYRNISGVLTQVSQQCHYWTSNGIEPGVAERIKILHSSGGVSVIESTNKANALSLRLIKDQ